METIGYGKWRETADTLHMIAQMMGKVKLEKMSPQPEWNHSLLYITARGFSTGLVPDRPDSFEILLDLIDGRVIVNSTSGKKVSFELREGGSVADYYADLMAALDYIGHPVKINEVPQEYYSSTPFSKQTHHVYFNSLDALNHFKVCTLARNALLQFSAPFRGKKILPSLFWGSFDLSTVLFSGVEKAFPGKSIIEQSAFDEQFVEFGFWAGDPTSDEPSFYAMAYPFMQGKLNMDAFKVKTATYSPEKAECFLMLKDVLATDDPHETIVEFCQDAFAAITDKEEWKRMAWFTKPLLPGETHHS
ncbi:MAG: DUF5996 family protein [Coriobacteriia bacterium]|nr:DUF5996 family protein [Coriobacteriia bacterium]